MFVETKREGEAKEEPSVEGFIAWLEKQPANGRYDYLFADRCAWAQYSGRTQYTLPDEINLIVHGGDEAVEYEDRWTFGAALRRAREALKTAKREEA